MVQPIDRWCIPMQRARFPPTRPVGSAVITISREELGEHIPWATVPRNGGSVRNKLRDWATSKLFPFIHCILSLLDQSCILLYELLLSRCGRCGIVLPKHQVLWYAREVQLFQLHLSSVFELWIYKVGWRASKCSLSLDVSKVEKQNTQD